jgi:hypothetical protein
MSDTKQEPKEDLRKEERVEQGGEVRGEDQPGEEVRVGDQLPEGGRDGEPEGGDQEASGRETLCEQRT